MKKLISSISAIAALALALTTQPAQAQSYSYSWGTSRVVNKSQDGLSNPSGTYIGTGTLSKSAQGQNAGITGDNSNNSGLPKVNLGAHIKTPGDGLYQKPPAAMPPGPVKMQNINGMHGVQQKMVPANYGNQQYYNNNNNNNYNPNQTVYYPGQNAQPNTNTYNQQPAPRMIYKPNNSGAATYGEQSTYTDNETVQSTKRRY